MNIIINGKIFSMGKGKDRIKYETIVSIAGYNYEQVPTVTYRADHRNGALMRGNILLVEEGMVINCCDTSNA